MFVGSIRKHEHRKPRFRVRQGHSVSGEVLRGIPRPGQLRGPFSGRNRPVRCHSFNATIGARHMLLQEHTKRPNDLCHSRQRRAQPAHSLQELHELARNLGAPHRSQAGQPLRIVLGFPLRVHFPTPCDVRLEKGAFVSRRVQADVVEALQNQAQRIEQVSLVQPPINHIVHPGYAVQPLQHACKRRLEVRDSFQNSLRDTRRRS